MKVDGILERAQLEPRTSDHPSTMTGGIWYRTDTGEIKYSTGTDVISLALPTGVVMPYAGSSAPSGWLLCQGQEVSRTTYAQLDSIIGTTYGSYTNGAGGAGTTHFRLPDLRGRAPIGAGTGTGLTARSLGATVGAESHTLALSEIPSHDHGGATGNPSATHTHTITARTLSAQAEDIGFNFRAPGASSGTVQNITSGNNSANHTHTISSAGSGGSHNNMQPSLALNFIIRY